MIIEKRFSSHKVGNLMSHSKSVFLISRFACQKPFLEKNFLSIFTGELSYFMHFRFSGYKILFLIFKNGKFENKLTSMSIRGVLVEPDESFGCSVGRLD